MKAKSVALCLALTACATQTREAPPQVRGHWRVVGSFCSPRGCAVPDSEAIEWQGRLASYGGATAGFPGKKCSRPAYTVESWPSSGTYGGATFERLGLTGDTATVVAVSCGNAPRAASGDTRWDAPGAFLIVKDERHLLMVWESRFFELERRS